MNQQSDMYQVRVVGYHRVMGSSYGTCPQICDICQERNKDTTKVYEMQREHEHLTNSSLSEGNRHNDTEATGES